MHLSNGTVKLAAQAKGAGMIEPRYATMFCFIQTDARLRQETLDLLTGVCVKRSFDRISVDGQLSTSDTVFALANGGSGVTVEPESDDELRFGEALDALLRQLALVIVADGEGARRIGTDRGARARRGGGAGGAPDRELPAREDGPARRRPQLRAHPAGRRAGLAGGRAVRCRPVDRGPQVASAGDALELDEAGLRELEQLVQGDEIEYELTLPGEGGETEVFFSDLGPGYVSFNAEYTS